MQRPGLSCSVLLGLIFAAWPFPAAALELSLEDVPVAGGEFRFQVKGSEPLDALPIRSQDEHVQLGSTLHYQVFADLNEIKFATRGGYFRYELYAQPKPGSSGEPTRFMVVGDSVGAFFAQMVEVEFQISGDFVEYGKIALPIFCLESPRYLESPPWAEPEEVELPGTRKEIPVRLKNLLTKLPVSITSIRQSSEQDIWKTRLRLRDSDQFREFEINPASVADGVLVFEVVPNSRAFTRVLFPRTRKRQLESVTAYLDYSTPWGVPQSLEIVLPVRFVPWPPLLFVAVALGTIAGSFVPVLVGRRNRSQWLRAFAASLLVGIVVELVAMLLIGKLDSEVRILGFDLDPFEWNPALLIGFSMGLLGFRSYDFIRKILPQPIEKSD